MLFGGEHLIEFVISWNNGGLLGEDEACDEVGESSY